MDTSDCSLVADADARGIDVAFPSEPSCLWVLGIPSSDSIYYLLYVIRERQNLGQKKIPGA